MRDDFSFSPEETSRNWLMIAAAAVLVCLIAGVIVYAVLSLMGPEVGNIFTNTVPPLE